MVFAFFIRNLTVGVIHCDPLITTVCFHRNLRIQCPTHAFFVKLKVVNTSFGLLHTEDQARLGIRKQLRLYGMTFLLAGIVFFLFFLGRSMGLFVTSTTIVCGLFSPAINAFLPGKRKVPSRMRTFSTQVIEEWTALLTTPYS